MMQQHTSNVNAQGQPPEKKMRVVGGFNNNDQSNYDYQVMIVFSFSFNKRCFVTLLRTILSLNLNKTILYTNKDKYYNTCYFLFLEKH